MKTTGIDTKGKYVKMKHAEYEHLAKTFFDTRKRDFPNLEKKNKHKVLFKNVFLSGGIAFVILGLFLAFSRSKETLFSKSVAIYDDKSPIFLRYNFLEPGSSKVSTFSFTLNNLDVRRYHSIEIAARMEKQGSENSTIKVRLENSRLENDSVYMKNIGGRWQGQQIPLSNFRRISDWSSLKSITFIVEDWNAANKEDAFIIDTIRFSE